MLNTFCHRFALRNTVNLRGRVVIIPPLRNAWADNSGIVGRAGGDVRWNNDLLGNSPFVPASVFPSDERRPCYRAHCDSSG